MTKSSIWFIIAGIAVYFLANQTQIGWLYLFDAIIWGLLVFSAVISWHTVRKLNIERQVLLPRFDPYQLSGPVEDEAVEVRLKLTNRGRLARHFIRVTEKCPFEQAGNQDKAFFISTVKAGSAEVFSYKATCYQRGYYPAATAVIESGGPLGLAVRKRSFVLPVNLTVYPRYYPMEERPAAETTWSEWGQHVRSSSADEFYGSREYRFGDPLKHIHWRNTARLGQFMLKQFEESRQGAVAVAFDTEHNPGAGRETTLEYSIRIAASLARLAAESGRTVDLFTGGTRLSGAGWQEAMDHLARLGSGGKGSLADLTQAVLPDQTVVAVVAAADSGQVPLLAALSQRARKLVIILLEGFAPDEYSQEFYDRLKGLYTEIIRCSLGGLEQCIEELNGALRESDAITPVREM